ncbi:uncharacterized protein BDR25DRAFT_358967 [Lindgomyces ingoldianus]|uniref:Uncharacterized protein n=1 Tax=Lindgomyces ingoldianus TaxID=673940 RepID=A0ACB6QIZ4_9PLEO|nr:uncharacterized protein BDR25DRAFT_358967 [Lindgomyces ingoldianus]KAF2466906.1 hypothetical protein BDR25DRAFT_358967 [Lindgomyces ingoldianus]
MPYLIYLERPLRRESRKCQETIEGHYQAASSTTLTATAIIFVFSSIKQHATNSETQLPVKVSTFCRIFTKHDFTTYRLLPSVIVTDGNPSVSDSCQFNIIQVDHSRIWTIIHQAYTASTPQDAFPSHLIGHLSKTLNFSWKVIHYSICSQKIEDDMDGREWEISQTTQPTLTRSSS